MFELTHVPRPCVAAEHLDGSSRESLHVTSIRSVVFVKKMRQQQRNIHAPSAQRGDLDRDDVEPVKEIFSEGACLHPFPQWLIGGRHDPDIDAQGLLTPHALDAVLLQHPQHPLHLQR